MLAAIIVIALYIAWVSGEEEKNVSFVSTDLCVYVTVIHLCDVNYSKVDMFNSLVSKNKVQGICMHTLFEAFSKTILDYCNNDNQNKKNKIKFFYSVVKIKWIEKSKSEKY